MKLFSSPNSPYVRKVRVAVIELDLEAQVELVPIDVWGLDVERLARHNPLARIPTLLTAEGEAVFDSPLICEYLDGLGGTGALFPDDPAERLRARRLLALGDGLVDAAVAGALEMRRRPEALRWQEWIDHQQRAIVRTLDWLEARCDELAGPLHIGHIAVGCAVGYVERRFSDLGWRNGRPHLAGWFDAISARRSFRATAPVG